MSPVVQARLLLFASWLPALVATVALGATLAPAFGWIADPCGPTEVTHGHPHLCPAHFVATSPGAAIVVLASLLVGRLAWAITGRVRGGLVALKARRALDRVTCRLADPDLRVLPLEMPQAFVVGVMRPRVYVTQGLLAEENREHLDPVLAHERAHVRRGDPLRRLVAGLGLTLHLPGVSAAIESRLAYAHELACDAEAAWVVGSRARVARALVHVARRQALSVSGALSFGASHLGGRIRHLLDERPPRPGPGASTLAMAALAAVVLAGFFADLVHHGVEILLGVLGG